MIYSRQIFFSTARLTFFATASLVLLFLAGNAIRDAFQLFVGGKIDALFLLRTLITFIPAAFAYALPIGTVLAVLASMGRMAADGEILALETAGLNRFRMAIPIIAWSCICCAIAFGATLFAAPYAAYSYKRQLQEYIRRDPIRFLRPHTFIRDFPNCIIYAGGRKGAEMTNLHIWEIGPDAIPKTILHAARGEFSMDKSGKTIIVLLHEGFMERIAFGRPGKTMNFDNFSFNLDCDKIFSRAKIPEKRLRYMTLFELIAARNAWTSTATTTEGGGTDGQRRRDRNTVNFAIQQNISTAFAIIPLSLIAFHMALKFSRRETATNGAIAIGLCMAYYSLSIAISWLQNSVHLRADWIIWMPCAALLAIAAALFSAKFH
jgi:lipopolysaccharide export system permease protein